MQFKLQTNIKTWKLKKPAIINKHAKMLQQITGMNADNSVSLDIDEF